MPVAERCSADPLFDRDLYLLRQKHLSAEAKYFVFDDAGQPLAFVERPSHVTHNVLAVIGAVAAAAGAFVLLAVAADMNRGVLRSLLGALALPAAVAVLLVGSVALSRRRHVTFYRGAARDERVLEVRQDSKLQLLHASYTIRDADGRPLARLRKDPMASLVRKRWEIRGLDGAVLYVAYEDSVFVALLRRVLGPFFGLLRTNFVFIHATTRRQIGELRRKLTILDRYVLDLTWDRRREMDRRYALALGVMLDTGELR